MFERYTEHARRTLFFARYEATQAGAAAIEVHHLLLGLSREARGNVRRLLVRANLSPAELRTAIDALIGTRGRHAPALDVPFSDQTKHALAAAAEEADVLVHEHIDTEHFLLGILRERGSVAASVLIAHGLQIETVREEITTFRRDTPAPPDARVYRSASPPSEVRISSSTRSTEGGTSESRGLDEWSLEGFCVRPLLSEIFDRHPPLRIELPTSLDNDRRYDVVMRCPHDPMRLGAAAAMQSAVAQHFNVVITRESRTANVYVLTAPRGDSAMTRESDYGGGLGSVSLSMERIDDPASTAAERQQAFAKRFSLIAPSDGHAPPAIGRMSGSISMPIFCDLLERSLGRAVIDETGLADASYQIDSGPDVDSTEEFFRVLREQFGLGITPERRDVTMLVVRPRDAATNP